MKIVTLEEKEMNNNQSTATVPITHKLEAH